MHKIVLMIFAGVLKFVAFTGKMLDTGCFILDIQDSSNSEIETHPASRDQDPGSANAVNGFPLYYSDEILYFMQLQGLCIQNDSD